MLVEMEKLRALADATIPLAEAAKTHAHGETDRTATGEIVLAVC